jgi:hypothetical protein
MKPINQERNFLLALVELLFALLLIFSVVVSIEELKDKKQEDSNLKLPGRYMIIMKWPQNEYGYSNDDVDLHVIDPQGHHAWFLDDKAGESFLNLDTPDDTGMPVKYYTNRDGKMVMSDFHEERVTIFQTVPGPSYKAIAFMYNKRLTGEDIKVTFTLIDLEKGSQEILKEEVVLSGMGQQAVAFQFSLDEAGNLVGGSVNKNPYPISDTKRYR